MAQIKKTHKWLYLATVVVAFGVLAGYWFVLSPTHNAPQSTKVTDTNSAPSNGEKKSTNSSSFNQGTATDNKGQTHSPITTTQSQWQHSQSELLTLQQPVANASIAAGFTLSGTTSVNNVHYRLIDNKVGVISQGIISVIAGKFSATINFKSYDSAGRLDVFNTDSNGKEINEVQLKVNFGA